MSIFRIFSILALTVSLGVSACPEGTEVCLSLDESTGEVTYISTEAIAGFQMPHSGCVGGISGGDAETAFTAAGLNLSGSMILAFSLTGANIPANTTGGTLFTLTGVPGSCSDEVSEDLATCEALTTCGDGGDEACVWTSEIPITLDCIFDRTIGTSNRKFSDVGAQALVDAWDGSDCKDELACNYNADAMYADNSFCTYPETNFDCDGNCIATADDTSLDYDSNGDSLADGGYDCSGTCGGSSVVDACGNCAGDCVADGDGLVTCGTSTNNTVTADCAGTCGGTSALDDCGVCDGANASQDCNGVCDGPGVVNTDGDGACCASGTIDCANVCDGSGVVNTDGDGACCASGTIDCANVCDGLSTVGCDDLCSETPAVDDACGICGGTETDPANCGDNDNDNFIVHGLTLSNIYPNPFNPTTTVEFSVMNAGNHTIDIYSTAGQLIETISQGYVSPGSYQVTWDANGMPSGIYIVRLIANGKLVNSRKVMLLK